MQWFFGQTPGNFHNLEKFYGLWTSSSGTYLLPIVGRYEQNETWEEEPNWQSPQTYLDTNPKFGPALELISRAEPSVEALTQEEIPEEGR